MCELSGESEKPCKYHLILKYGKTYAFKIPNIISGPLTNHLTLSMLQSAGVLMFEPADITLLIKTA